MFTALSVETFQGSVGRWSGDRPTIRFGTIHHLPLHRRFTGVWAGPRRIRHRLARHLPRTRRTAMVALRRSGTIRGQRHAKLLLGIAEIPHDGAQGEPEHPGMSLLAYGREGHAAGGGTPGPAPAVPVADDFPDLQRLRHVAVREDRAGHP